MTLHRDRARLTAAVSLAVLCVASACGVWVAAQQPPGRSAPVAARAATAVQAPIGGAPRRDILAPALFDPFQLRLPTMLHHGNRHRPLVALTFDTNLTAGMIAELGRGLVRRFVNDHAIAELDQLRVPATLFLSGLWIERYPDVTARLAADPLFELGSHSYSHLGFAPRCYDLGRIAPGAEVADIRRSEAVLARVTAHPTRWFRFPGGCYDSAALAAAQAAGVQTVQYDVPSGDAFSRYPQAVVANTLASVRDGSIVVLHLTGGNTAPVTDQALPAIVSGLRERGFVLVTVSELVAAGGCG